ncbi:MAG: hypothetical protein K2W96_13975 [Gemmataceae bacterium]|nr:hypothetical protein [Gemmataceae bacterium]
MADEIAADEIILRHVPPGTLWQAPGPRITSMNFRLRPDKGETGVSVTRQGITSAERLMVVVGGDAAAGSLVGAAKVGDVRDLGFEVEPVPLPDDPGHSEIRSGKASLNDGPMRKRLANLFRILPSAGEATPARDESAKPA